MKEIEFAPGVVKALQSFPKRVKSMIGFALSEAQKGRKHPDAVPMAGFGGGGSVIEIIEDFDGDTYRAMYTTKIADKVVVLHAFQKKSKKGIATPKQEIELIQTRLQWAKEVFT